MNRSRDDQPGLVGMQREDNSDVLVNSNIEIYLIRSDMVGIDLFPSKDLSTWRGLSPPINSCSLPVIGRSN